MFYVDPKTGQIIGSVGAGSSPADGSPAPTSGEKDLSGIVDGANKEQRDQSPGGARRTSRGGLMSEKDVGVRARTFAEMGTGGASMPLRDPYGQTLQRGNWRLMFSPEELLSIDV